MTSNSESASVSPPPLSETLLQGAERIQEAVSPALGIPRLAAVDHLYRMLRGNSRRVEDSHRRQMRALDKLAGDKVPEEAPPLAEDDDMGISVQGDTTVTIHQAAPAAKSRLAQGAALALALAGLPAAGALLQWWLNRPAAPAPATTTINQGGDALPYDFGIR